MAPEALLACTTNRKLCARSTALRFRLVTDFAGVRSLERLWRLSVHNRHSNNPFQVGNLKLSPSNGTAETAKGHSVNPAEQGKLCIARAQLDFPMHQGGRHNVAGPNS